MVGGPLLGIVNDGSDNWGSQMILKKKKRKIDVDYLLVRVVGGVNDECLHCIQ